MDMAETPKPRHTPPRSGEREIRGSQKALERAKKLAPEGVIDAKRSSRHVDHADTIVTKSGRTIFVSPAKSATTVEDWSKALKK
jgi:hypothetical protein